MILVDIFKRIQDDKFICFEYIKTMHVSNTPSIRFTTIPNLKALMPGESSHQDEIEIKTYDIMRFKSLSNNAIIIIDQEDAGRLMI